MTQSEQQSPGVKFPPPLIFVAAIVLGWVLERTVPLPVDAVLPAGLRVGVGWAAVALGACGLLAAMLTFARGRTAIFPNRPARMVVASGIYGVSRNPMYVALAIGTGGASLLLNTVWILVLVPGVLAALYWLVIRREERYLASAFGDCYAEYCARVRRWL